MLNLCCGIVLFGYDKSFFLDSRFSMYKIGVEEVAIRSYYLNQKFRNLSSWRDRNFNLLATIIQLLSALGQDTLAILLYPLITYLSDLSLLVSLWEKQTLFNTGLEIIILLVFFINRTCVFTHLYLYFFLRHYKC